MKNVSGAWGNFVLDAFPERRQEDLSFLLEPVRIKQGQILCDVGERPSSVYFPTTSVVSLLDTMADGAAIEVAVIGNDGFASLCALTGVNLADTRVQARSAGQALRMSAQWLREVFSSDESVRTVLMLCVQALLSQIARTTACTRHHSLVQQVSKWLLLMFDRVPGEELRVTQDVLASTLGVRRERIAHVAQTLRDEGVIAYSRGRLTMLDRVGLEARSCECYGLISHQFERLCADRPGRGSGATRAV